MASGCLRSLGMGPLCRHLLFQALPKGRRESVSASGVGQPQTFHLNLFGEIVLRAFGTCAFLVGSATKSKDWRDVDVRLILSDEDWVREEFGDPKNPGERWAAYCMAFSALGKQMTGLPIDFQIQQQTDANERDRGQREALLWIYRS